MSVPWLDQPVLAVAGAAFAVGLIAGSLLYRWGVRLTPLPQETQPGVPEGGRLVSLIPVLGPLTDAARGNGSTALGRLTCELGTGALYAGLVWCLAGLQCQQIPEVAPSEWGAFLRIPFHLALATFLMASVVTDLRDYVIPDAIVVPGLIVGLAGQFASGELQMQHLWVDWNAEIPGIKGPDFPAWIDSYRRLHGVLVGLAGAVTGAGLTWLVRALSTRLLGQEAMGLGDVTLMAMIGSYLGWQPTLFVFLIAPLCGLVLSLAQRFAGGKSYLPYGPFLSMATVIVLATWKWLWMPLRYVFGHWPTLAGLIGGAAAGLVVLLVLARLYRMIPVRESERYSRPADRDEPPAA